MSAKDIVDEDIDDAKVDEDEIESDLAESAVIENSQSEQPDEVGPELEDIDDDEDIEVDTSDKPYEKITIKINNDKRLTTNMLTAYEQTEIISNRIEQICNGSEVFVDVKDLTTATEMAKRELFARRCPLKIHRVMGVTYDRDRRKILEYVEEWDPNEMTLKSAH